MKKSIYHYFFYFFCFSNLISATAPQETLLTVYEHFRLLPSDINEHLSVLAQLAQECSSVTEIGLRNMISTWAILYGLSENSSNMRSYTGIDIVKPQQSILSSAQKLAHQHGINFDFIRGNDMNLEIESTDFLFIDSLHTYCHLTYELEKVSPKVSKYIAMHDTSAPWGNADDTQYRGNYSEYPSEFDRSKRGLWPAVEDFLTRHPEWVLVERRLNNHGFTILKRII